MIGTIESQRGSWDKDEQSSVLNRNLKSPIRSYRPRQRPCRLGKYLRAKKGGSRTESFPGLAFGLQTAIAAGSAFASVAKAR
jgi:hypothetical protein